MIVMKLIIMVLKLMKVLNFPRFGELQLY